MIECNNIIKNHMTHLAGACWPCPGNLITVDNILGTAVSNVCHSRSVVTPVNIQKVPGQLSLCKCNQHIAEDHNKTGRTPLQVQFMNDLIVFHRHNQDQMSRNWRFG